MERCRIDDTKELDYQEAVEIMKSGGAITDGTSVFGISDVRVMDGYEIKYVCKYEDWDQYPVKFILLEDFEDTFKERDWNPYVIPLTAEKAVEEMKRGYVVRDIEDHNRPLYFIHALHHPLHGYKMYVYTMLELKDDPEIYGLPEDFGTYHPGPHYERVDIPEKEDE